MIIVCFLIDNNFVIWRDEYLSNCICIVCNNMISIYIRCNLQVKLQLTRICNSHVSIYLQFDTYIVAASLKSDVSVSHKGSTNV